MACLACMSYELSSVQCFPLFIFFYLPSLLPTTSVSFCCFYNMPRYKRACMACMVISFSVGHPLSLSHFLMMSSYISKVQQSLKQKKHNNNIHSIKYMHKVLLTWFVNLHFFYILLPCRIVVVGWMVDWIRTLAGLQKRVVVVSCPPRIIFMQGLCFLVKVTMV